MTPILGAHVLSTKCNTLRLSFVSDRLKNAAASFLGKKSKQHFAMKNGAEGQVNVVLDKNDNHCCELKKKQSMK